MMSEDEETIEVTLTVQHGLGLLEIVQGDEDCALLIDGMPVAMVWDAALESPTNYFVRAYDSEPLGEHLARHAPLEIPDPNDVEAVFDGALRPLLHALANGDYRVLLESSLGLTVPEQRDSKHDSAWRFMAWAGLHETPADGGLLLGTRPRELLSPERIADFEQHIRSGARPPVVLLGSTRTPVAFIVDGHHKLEAYRSMSVPPAAIVILAETPRQISIEEGCTLLEEAYKRCGDIASAHYRAVRSVDRRRTVAS